MKKKGEGLPAKLGTKKNSLVFKAQSLEIKTKGDLQEANELLLALKALRKAIEKHKRPNIKKANELHRGLVADLKNDIDPIDRAIDALGGEGGKITVYVFEEERRRAEQEVHLRAEMDKAAGSALEGVGGDAITHQISINIPSVQDELYGIRAHSSWKAEVIDLRALLQAVLDGTAFQNVIEVNEGVLNRYAAQFDGTVEWPGVRFYKTGAIRATGRG